MDNGGQAKVKMSGYLYKKCKKRMISSWKMYWFVLEDRLLLYYRSKDEYQAISPCKGSINLGPPCVVKSFPSIPNAFQIETRTNTFTLKAENSEDQMKWMQTIMAALNQNQNFSSTESPKRLNHFRYSLDDLIPEREPNDPQVLKRISLERQHTMPDRLKTEQESNKEIIQRLQKIGAQSYGGSLGAISKIATKKSKSPVLANNRNSQGSLPETESDTEKIAPMLRPLRSLQENVYERISGDSNSSHYSNKSAFMVDNENYSVPVRKSLQKAASVGSRDSRDENDPYSMIKRQSSEINRDRRSVLVENDQYAISHRLSKASSRGAKSVLVENDTYQLSQRFSKEEAVYAEPKVNAMTDHNKNSVLVENAFYTPSNSKSEENVYEDLDDYNLYSQPVLKNEDCSSQSSQEVKGKEKLRKKDSNDSKEEKNKHKSMKKSRSFIKRVWKKRGKKLERQEKQEEEEEIYEEVDPKAVEKAEKNNDNTVQMLSELQNILEHKKSLLKATVSNSSNKSTEHKPEDEKTNKGFTSESDVCPTLPPKTQKPPKPNQSNEPEQVRSLDEILEDLNKEKIESKSKVKQLIEKFSEPESDDVVLRRHEHTPDFKINRHSDDLNKLLDELAKVTSAPIMTPGVTSSLVNPSLPDEEWLRLLPVRQRRLSEPDYDVPRPHKSIQLPAKSENTDAIPATRFFGPVLPPTITDNSPIKEESICTSMTPDSLEIETVKSPNPPSYTSHNYLKTEEEPVTDLKYFSSNNHTIQDDKIIYAMPKSYLSVATHIVNTCQNICSAQLAEECTIIYKNVKNVDLSEEIFKDSLELCNESSTEF